MAFNIGIAAHILNTENVYIAAVTYYDHDPIFGLYGITIPQARDNFCATTFVKQRNIVTGVNTAINRSVEKLLVRELIVPNKTPDIAVIVRPAFRNLSFVLPHRTEKKHWLLTVSKKLLNLWLPEEDTNVR